MAKNSFVAEVTFNEMHFVWLDALATLINNPISILIN